MIMKTTVQMLFLLFSVGVVSQQISKEELIFLTPEWKGDRFEDGRPKVEDNIPVSYTHLTLPTICSV